MGKIELSARTASFSGESHKRTSPPDRAAHRTDDGATWEWELVHVERARRDPRAFAPLYEVYADLVWKYALSRLGDPERAADATSQTFSRALAALPRFRPERRGDGTTFRAWLMTIARNVVIDETRRHRPTTALDAPAAQPWLVDRSRSPEDAAIAADERRRIERALAQLPEKQRQIVELCAIGAKGAEIARLLQMSIGAVRTAHFRAYVRLRELLGDPHDDQDTSA
ncbi:MAG TPA: sigma-70 family RNA polymerase sigma factor [Thermomicrobiales bacterium]|nr:sigma-70 family RNA polymerase sigma factor [Thermomicrobiales bacterium]